jgi:acetylornithine deacetylase/succinyl-diaminopimelate desuccinylase-like protein
MLPFTTARLSLRLPPTLPAAEAGKALKRLLETDPPYGTEVSFTGGEAATGWNAPALSPWLNEAVTRASKLAFGRAPSHMGEGGSIPFMGMLGEKFPDTQFVVTGVLGPHSNAHGPNEFLHIPTAKRVTVAVASIIADHLGSKVS